MARGQFPLVFTKLRKATQYCPVNVFHNLRKSMIYSQLRVKMIVIDLNFDSAFGHAFDLGGMVYERWQNDLLATYGLPSASRVPQVCRAVRRRPPSADLFLHGPVLLHGLRPAHLSRELAGHRSLSAIPWRQALPHGHSRKGISQHTGRRQRATRLANLRRLRAC